MADVEALRARLAGLSPEERAELDDVLKGTLGRQALSRSMTDEKGKTLSYPRMEPVRFEHFDPSTTEGAINNAMLTAAGMGGPVSTLVGAARAGLGPALKAGAGMLPRIAVGAGIGGALRASPLPVVGGGTFKEGAMLGGAIGAGQGGTGALWKHGKRKKTIEWLINQAMGGADEAAEEVAAPAARTAAKGAGRAAVSVADEGADDVVQALMRGDSQYGPMGREAAEQIAAAISKQAGRGTTKAATDIPRAVAGAKTKAAVSKAVPVESGSGTTAEIVERIQTWRNKHKFSDGQILDSLAELYKIPRAQGKMLLRQFE